MIFVIAAVGVLAVLAVTYLAVFRVGKRLEVRPAPAVLEVDTAVEWIIERLPFEVTAALSEDDVHQIVLWNLDWFDTQGMASEFGEEIGGEDIEGEHVATTDESLDYVVERVLRSERDIDAVHAAVVNEKFLEFFVQIGAVGAEAEPDT